jgi:hypothetical protein
VVPKEFKGERTMPAEISNPEIPAEKNDSSAADVREQQFLDRIADSAAKRAEETEKHYDEAHGIFTS